MALSDNNSSWNQIQSGVSEVEKMITQQDYNGAMVKSRQTLEFMVKQLAQRAHMPEGADLKTMIEELYVNRWISKTTCEHYHKIRMSGNKAVHEDYDNAYDANQVYHMLSQEVYTFANDYSNAQKGSRIKNASRTASSSSSQSRSRGKASRNAAGSRTSRRGSAAGKIAAAAICIVIAGGVIFFAGKFVGKTVKDHISTVPETTTVAETLPPTEPETTQAEEEAVVWRTTANLNVRSQPNTNCMIYGRLNSGEEVTYIESYNDEWAVIDYNGQEAYVSSQYLIAE
jgi:uncharacterized protein YgiM (DUF1202 family)